MELFCYEDHRPIWISFENPTGEPGGGGKENFGAKGHPFEFVAPGEEKVLCDVEGPGVIRRIWFTLEDRSPEMLEGIYLNGYWDGEKEPSVCAPIGDFFCMGYGGMKTFENEFFASPEGRSFLCQIPMPFFKRGKLTLKNCSGKENGHLFYDVDMTKQELPEGTMYFHADHQGPAKNPLGKDVTVLEVPEGKGRFLGMNVSVFPDMQYKGSWWGEGEVKIYLNGEETPSLVGTGTEDYISTAWGQGVFFNRLQGCAAVDSAGASFYRFHQKDPIFFQNGCKVELQAIGGAPKALAREIQEQGASMLPLAYDLGGRMTHLYRRDWKWEEVPEEGFITFYRQDSFSTVAYYYLRRSC